MKNLLLFLIASTFTIQVAFSQKWTIYPKLGGAFNTVMTACVDDGKGTLWFGSFNKGIYAFDGMNWQKSSDSTPNAINDMMIVDNDIWAAANGGLVRIPNYELHNIQTIKFNDTSSNLFWTVAYDSSGTIWVGSGDVSKTLLLSYKNGEWKEIDCSVLGEQSYIPSIVVDSKNRKWFVSDAGLTMYNDTTFVTYNHTNSSLPQTSFTHLEMDAKGVLWIATVGYGIFKFDGTTFLNYNSQNTILPLQDMFTGIAFDQSDIAWFSTQVNGVYSFNGNEWTNFKTSNSGIVSNMIRATAIDKQNRKIFGSIDQGVIIYDDNITSVGSDEKELSLYPNPVTDHITLRTDTKEISTIRIFNHLGEEVTSKCSGIENIDANGVVTINVSKLPPSVYFLQKGQSMQKFITIK